MRNVPLKIIRTTPRNQWEDSEPTPEVLAEPFATIEPLTGRELELAMQTQARHTHRIRFRWGPTLAGLKTSDKVEFRGRTFELTSVINIKEENRWLECMAVESNG